VILTGHQPAYMPWPGYLDKIARADVFVYMDAVQFERGSFINRNRIKTQHGAHWLTVPVKLKRHTDLLIRDIRIDSLRRWPDTHLKTIWHAYAKALRFFENFKELEALYSKDRGTIADLCAYQLRFWLEQYGIETPIHPQPVPAMPENKTAFIIAMCRYHDADVWLSGPMGRDYLDLEEMEKAGLKVEFHDYTPPTYPQLWGDFIPRLSILDMWMNTEKNPWMQETYWSSQRTQTMKSSGAEEPLPDTSRKAIGSTF